MIDLSIVEETLKKWIQTFATEIGDHSPYCSDNGGKSKNKANKNPNASSSSFEVATTERNIIIYLK